MRNKKTADLECQWNIFKYIQNFNKIQKETHLKNAPKFAIYFNAQESKPYILCTQGKQSKSQLGIIEWK